MSDIKYAYPLTLNKVASPHYATATLRRPRLIEKLHASAACRATVVAADAGYGKTTLLWQWEREANVPCYWYKLDRNDRDWTFHISYLIEAISRHHAGFGRRAHSMLQQLGGPGSSRPGVAAYLLAEMHERLTEPCTFIIDDWQYVNAVTEVRGLWNQILRDAPATCRFIFASRAKPKLQFARFKTHGGYAELGTDALRFTQHEIDELFRDIYKDPLDASELIELDRRTEGWPASLQLVEVSLREHDTADDRRAFIESITADTESDLFEFLAEEVLDQQPEETRNFLLTTSILQQITPEVAERLAGVHDGRRELAELEHRGLFTNRLDENRYRYHNVFRDFLERRLAADRSEAEVVGLHIHAASYFETSEQWPEAIHHYLSARLQRQAARLTAKYGEEVASEGRLGLVDEWLQRLPAEPIKQNARLSLLYGEASGIRGDWDRALAALQRARDFFARKGDRRLEALACLKLSSVYLNYGDADRAAVFAEAGSQLVPPEDPATRLRLDGNLALSRVWQTQPLEAVVRECERIAADARSLGLDHYAAIAHHNIGGALTKLGRLDDAVRHLERAAEFWANPPTSPFADNLDLVQALLLQDQVERARRVAGDAMRRTAPWPRPYLLARWASALVKVYEGRFKEAISDLGELALQSSSVGAARRQLFALLIECLYLDGASPDRMLALSQEIADPPHDRRYELEVAPVDAIARHLRHGRSRSCNCHEWRTRIPTDREPLTGAIAQLKLGVLALEHPNAGAYAFAWSAAAAVVACGLGASMRWWLRRYVPFARAALKREDGIALIQALTESDTEGWRSALPSLLAETEGSNRKALLSLISHHATPDTIDQLRTVEGSDVAAVRRRIQERQAARLYVRTFGGVSIHRGGWDGPQIRVDKKRVRSLLAVIAAHAAFPLSRDATLEMLWPDADADLAVNSLNQTVFQLRRYLDPAYRAGDSPEYIISTSDEVRLNPELVRTDLNQILKLPDRVAGTPAPERLASIERTLELVRGEFLADLRYEDWASRLQLAVLTDVRRRLMPATDSATYAPELAVRTATILVMLDPFDETAVVRLAEALSKSGRRMAARQVIVDYIQRASSEFGDDVSEQLRNAGKAAGVSV